MTNKFALGLGLFILLAIGLDVANYGTEHILFLAKKLADFLEWLAFWR